MSDDDIRERFFQSSDEEDEDQTRVRKPKASDEGTEGEELERQEQHNINEKGQNRKSRRNITMRNQSQPMAMCFNPSMYNITQFKFKHLPVSSIRKSWASWIRWFETIMEASNVNDEKAKKAQLLAMGGQELQDVYFELPTSNVYDGVNPYSDAKQLLENYFAPQQHAVFERYLFIVFFKLIIFERV